jgi:hypothetical protein
MSAGTDPIERPFHPDGTSDLGKIWRRALVKPNAIMFFHIPLQEAYDDPDVEDGRELDVGETYDTGSGASETNSGMLDALQDEVKVLAHGHCHLTDRCRRVRGVW